VVKYIPMLSGKTAMKIAGFFDVVWRAWIDDKKNYHISVEASQNTVCKSRWGYIKNDTKLSFTDWLNAFKGSKVEKQEVVVSIESTEDYIKIAVNAWVNEDLFSRTKITFNKLLEAKIEDLDLQGGKIKSEVEKAPDNLFSEAEKITYYKFIDLACEFIKAW
jgi:hypothetical protein